MSCLIYPDHLLAINSIYWPHDRLYGKQIDVVDSVLTCRETYVTAGNELGKDYVAGFIALTCFMAALELNLTCKIVTTSVEEDHLKILWGEIGKRLRTAKYPILAQHGGKFIINFQEMRRFEERDAKNPSSLLIGLVCKEEAKMAGHHAEYTLGIGDEASAIRDEVRDEWLGWCDHMLWISNPRKCNNFYKKMVKKGSLLAA